jgi:DsbC/DsbD-like thiol-disulfide interchange protein
MLISLFLLLNSYNPDLYVTNQLSGNDFVYIDPIPELNLSPGESENIGVLFKIKEGYHIQANKVLDDNLIPSSITTQSPEEIKVENPVFPVPVEFHLKNVKEAMLVFHNTLRINLPVNISENTKDGIFVISGNLHYQACDSVKCYFPRDLPFEIGIIVK